MKNQRLKKHYQQSIYANPSSFPSERFPFLRNVYFRKMRTTQEKAVNYQHLIEVEEMGLQVVVRGIRGCRCKPLVNEYEDVASYFLNHQKSWKHNSKRKNQHYK